MAMSFTISGIVVVEKVDKEWIIVEVYWLGEDHTTMVPSNQPRIVLDNKDHECVRIILSTQY